MRATLWVFRRVVEGEWRRLPLRAWQRAREGIPLAIDLPAGPLLAAQLVLVLDDRVPVRALDVHFVRVVVTKAGCFDRVATSASIEAFGEYVGRGFCLDDAEGNVRSLTGALATKAIRERFTWEPSAADATGLRNAVRAAAHHDLDWNGARFVSSRFFDEAAVKERNR